MKEENNIIMLSIFTLFPSIQPYDLFVPDPLTFPWIDHNLSYRIKIINLLIIFSKSFHFFFTRIVVNFNKTYLSQNTTLGVHQHTGMQTDRFWTAIKYSNDVSQSRYSWAGWHRYIITWSNSIWNVIKHKFN